MLCGKNEVGAHRAGVDNMEKDIHDGVLRPLRREGHRSRKTAIEVREKLQKTTLSAQQEQSRGIWMHGVDILIKTKTGRQTSCVH